MLKVQRQEELVRLCNTTGLLTVNEAAEILGTSPMTIRRDMEELAKEGRIERVRGGARSIVPMAQAAREYPHEKKRSQHSSEKQHIAQIAAGLINEGDAVFLGAGTTCELITQYLGEKSLSVVTNSLSAFELLKSNPNIELYLLGGLYRPKTSVLYGHLTEEALSSLSVDKVFFGVNGICAPDVMGHNVDISNLQRMALDKGRKRYILADSSKFFRRDLFTFYSLEQIDAVITDPGITPEQRAACEEYTQVMC